MEPTGGGATVRPGVFKTTGLAVLGRLTWKASTQKDTGGVCIHGEHLSYFPSLCHSATCEHQVMPDKPGSTLEVTV